MQLCRLYTFLVLFWKKWNKFGGNLASKFLKNYAGTAFSNSAIWDAFTVENNFDVKLFWKINKPFKLNIYKSKERNLPLIKKKEMLVYLFWNQG